MTGSPGRKGQTGQDGAAGRPGLIGPTPNFCEPGQPGSKGMLGAQGPIGPPGNDLAQVSLRCATRTPFMSCLCLFFRFYRRKG